MLRNIAVRYPAFIILILLSFSTASAQLTANFTVDKPSGCAPLAVSFANTSTGTSAAATYEWSFGNGNTSRLKNPGAIFREGKVYTVTLTVRDGNLTATKTQVVTVYAKPAIDLKASVNKHCALIPNTFTGKATNGDTITNYFWDFGDGVTRQLTDSQVTHTYVAAQNHTISLTVTSNHGCQNTLVKQNVVTVLPSLTASFNADKKTLCTITDAASFTNDSKGPGTLSYHWEFGDGTTSNAQSPSHVFKDTGVYTIKLSVTSSEGCTDDSIQRALINAANFKSDVELPATLCQATGIEFINKSYPVPDRGLWSFGDGNTTTTFSTARAYHYYATAGTYTLQLTNEFGACKQVYTKTIQVKPSPALKGFVVDITSSCGSPAKVNFKDTTAGAVKWQWDGGWPSYFRSTEQAPSHTFQVDNNHYVNLTVTNADGCSALTGKTVDIRRPYVQVSSPDASPAGEVRSCGPRDVRFEANTSETLTSYLWNFADGTTSTDAKPVHKFTKAGEYKVRLAYTTAKGCTGVSEFPYYVIVRDSLKADFTASQTDLCGNTPVTFFNQSGNYPQYVYYHWNFGDGYFQANTSQRHSVNHQFQEEGLYTISLIATDWVCSDTMVKKAYIKVSPPFPKISSYTNTCEGTRGTVTFNQASRKTDSWHWDFGDGSSLLLDKDEPQVKHTYAKTGWYKVVLTNTNGQCTVKDSMYVSVLLKQNPVLSADKTEVCSRDDHLKLTVSNLEKNPGAYAYYHGYSYRDWQYRDGSLYMGGGISAGNLEDMPFTMTIWHFTPGKEGFRLVVYPDKFNCPDTTNFIPLKIKGPIPGFKVDKPDPCKNGSIVYFTDTSKAMDNVGLTTWEWNFGDGKVETYSKGGTIFHQYAWPGTYMITLKVTDASGCSAIYQDWATAQLNSLKASFTSSATTISPGSTVSFYNTSQTSDAVNTTYKWLLADGKESTAYQAEQLFSKAGNYVIKLVARNTVTGCADTATTTIVVKPVNAAFTFSSSYIQSNNCLPVLVRFTNTSSNITKLKWDFGDGTVVNDQLTPSHIYTKEGVYKITLETYSDNGTQYVTVDSIQVKPAPTVRVSASILRSCTAQTVTLSALHQNAASFLWDLGDGTIIQASDTFSVHHYQTAGVYKPQLIAMDADGCPVSFSLEERIVIDSLSVQIKNLPPIICSPKEVFFDPVIFNIGADGAQQELTYHWDFGTGRKEDTANVRNPVFTYGQTGTYTASLEVASPSGCVKVIKATITAYQGLGGQISGPSEVCQGTAAQFTGSTLIPGQPQWKWIFDDGTIVQQQHAPAKVFNNPGTHPIKLLVDNNGCVDTISRQLEVHANPVITMSARQAQICEGKPLIVKASGATTYNWMPATGLNRTSGDSILASPATDTRYTVRATSTFGCTSTDSILISVVHPFQLQLAPEAAICAGSNLRLNASGASTYQWIQNTTGLSDTGVANPVASPDSSSLYTVVGSDAHGCFTDTAVINITVYEVPTVDAGPSVELIAGNPHLLTPVASSDVVQWTWSPGKYLSCTTCATPEAKPSESMNYRLTVTNTYGCTASDTVSINLLCSGSHINIPNAFTPNNDGVNDVFSLKGQGVRMVNHLRIYSRWGEVIFERSNFLPNDRSAAWDGKYKGKLVPVGSYVYVAEMSCNEQSFVQKGSVTVTY